MTHYLAAGLLLLAILFLSYGCGYGAKGGKIDFTGQGIGNTSGNLMQNYPFAETEHDAYVYINTHLFRINKASGQAVLNCADPGCSHTDLNCAAITEQWIALQAFESSVYAHDAASYDAFFTIEMGVREVAAMLNREANVEYYSSLAYGDRLYTFTSREELEVRDLNTGELVAAYPNCYPFMHGYFIENDVIYFINPNLELIAINTDGGNRRVIEADRASYLMSHQERLYFIQRGEKITLYSMDLGGGDRIKISENIMDYNIIGDTIFYTSFEDRELYMMNIDGSNPTPVDFKSLGGAAEDAQVFAIGVFPSWGKVAITLVNREAFVLISADGSDMRLVDVKFPPTR